MTTSGIRRAWDGSILASAGRRAWTGSLVIASARTVTVRARQLFIAASSVRTPARIERAIERSTAVSIEREVEDVVRTSFVYRWLITEPEHETVVLNLRDTYSLRPAVAVAHRLAKWTDRWNQSSMSERSQGGDATIAHLVAGSWTVRTIGRLLQPPKPNKEEEK